MKSSAIFVWILLFGPRMTAERAMQGIVSALGLILFGALVAGLLYVLREYSDEIVDASIGIWQREWKFLTVCGVLVTLALLIGLQRRR